MDYQEHMGVIRGVIPRKGKITDALIHDLFYRGRTLKYFQAHHLRQIRPTFKKIATEPKLQALSQLGYLANVQNGVYVVKEKAIRLLEITDNYKNRIQLLPDEPRGKGVEIYNTDVYCQCIMMEHYYALLHPNFDYVRPDGLLILKDVNKYKLIFLEVQLKLEQSLLNDKRNAYDKLSRDRKVYSYWKAYAKRLGLRIPQVNEFCFCVWLFVKEEITLNWPGWGVKYGFK